SLGDILVITICALICGADEWTVIELFGRQKRKWLKTFLELSNDIHSHDTFGHVFSHLDPKQLEQCFQ
ncbi:MAG: ISAs1 family transposase, partial [Planctomycetota bacterium]